LKDSSLILANRNRIDYKDASFLMKLPLSVEGNCLVKLQNLGILVVTL
jgi:hypothetical protein